MKQIFLMLAIIAGAISVNAQEDVRESSPSTGDLFEGFTRPLTFNRMIPPYGLEVTFTKTVHIIFPAAVRYVDLGLIDLLAAKADGAENVLRVKAATQGFRKESNLSVITEDNSYYTFNVKYADEPVKLSIEMADFLHTGYEINRPGNELPVYLSDLGSESPYLVRLIMETIHKNNRTKIKHIGSKNFGIQYLLKGLYSHNELLFFYFQLKNTSTVSFNVDYLVFKIVDRKVAKRTAIQEQVIIPLHSYNQITVVAGNKEERTVFTLPKFTIPNDRQLIIELLEKDGGRNQTLTVENADLIRAEVIDNLQVKVK
ncbi:MAG: conjugative transposon protein TraN [Dysgonamonadaceae bacterium]|jgi:conjugative transposon TraN protein|nr:conjugative transposon protein TraN [Dysgonamonadaceae bacterium]